MSKTAPRILYITSSWPQGKSFGGQLRALHIGRALQKIGDVTLMVVSSDDVENEVIKKTASEFEVLPPVRVKPAPNRSVIQRLRWAFDTRYLNVHGCAADDADRARLMNSLRNFDLVWVLNSRTPNILNQWHWPRSVLDLDDVPSTFHRSVWRNGSDSKRKLKAGVQMLLSKRRERLWKKRFSVLSVCSEADRQQLGGGPHIHVIPNGFERPLQTPILKPSTPPRIGFIGLYSYPPNLEGMRWFLRECWPQIKQQVPNARLRLAGKDTDGPLRPEGADIDALGWVNDPAEEIATWSLTVIPLLHGAGTRIKLADAFSRKCPVVSTSLGAFGYEVEHGRELLLADKPAEFVDACISLIRNPERGSQLAENAFSAFLKRWTWDAIEPRIHAAAEDALSQSRSSAR